MRGSVRTQTAGVGRASPVSVHSNAVPDGRGAAGIKQTEPRARAGKAASRCRKLEGPDGAGG